MFMVTPMRMLMLMAISYSYLTPLALSPYSCSSSSLEVREVAAEFDSRHRMAARRAHALMRELQARSVVSAVSAFSTASMAEGGGNWCVFLLHADQDC